MYEYICSWCTRRWKQKKQHEWCLKVLIKMDYKKRLKNVNISCTINKEKIFTIWSLSFSCNFSSLNNIIQIQIYVYTYSTNIRWYNFVNTSTIVGIHESKIVPFVFKKQFSIALVRWIIHSPIGWPRRLKMTLEKNSDIPLKMTTGCVFLFFNFILSLLCFFFVFLSTWSFNVSCLAFLIQTIYHSMLSYCLPNKTKLQQ